MYIEMMENDNTMLSISRAVTTIKTAILKCQARTLRNANSDVLALYYAVGQYISTESRTQKWGSGAIKTISEQLRKELPGLKGFSERSIRYMRQFYEVWCNHVHQRLLVDEKEYDAFLQPLAAKISDMSILQPAAAKLNVEAICQPTDSENKSPMVTELLTSITRLDFSNEIFDVEIAHSFLSISFTHHTEILTQTKTIEERLFYIRQAALNKWDKYKLRDCLKQDLFHHQAEMPNNFLSTLPKRVQALKAIEMFKDEYLLDYMNVEELGVRDAADMDERVVENAIVQNVKNFIMMFGKDFTFVGNQYHLEKFGKDHFVDLLFYNRELMCLVAVELKLGEFKPIYLGQLQTYLQILDDEVRKPNENPSIGIVLCQDMDKSYVEYVIQRYDSPMGVAKYHTSVDMPEELRKALPDIDSLKRLLSESNDV